MILLRELFNIEYPVEKIEDRGNRPIYRFYTPGGDEYQIGLVRTVSNHIDVRHDDMRGKYKRIELQSNTSIVSLEFWKKKINTLYPSQSRTLDVLGIEHNDYYHGIFSTVINVARREIKDKEVLEFSGEEKSRRKLYDRLVKRLKRDNDIIFANESYSGKSYHLIPKNLIISVHDIPNPYID